MKAKARHKEGKHDLAMLTAQIGGGKAISTYTFNSGDIPITINIYTKEGEFVPIYDVSISGISKNTEIVLERIMQELTTQVSLGMVDILNTKETGIIEKRFGEAIEILINKLVNLVNEKGRISSADAAKELGVSTTVIMEWVDFLEEEGIISLEYKFTKPFLVARKLTKKDVQGKAKEFSGKRDVFVRKAEVSLSFLEKESEKLETLKEEFDKIKKELGIDIGSVKGELEELKKYEQLKIDLDRKIEEQKTNSINKFQDITKQILREKEKCNSLFQEIKKEEEALEQDKNEANTIEQSEKLINNRLNSLKEIIQKIENRAKTEEDHIKNSENNIQKLMLLAKTMQLNVEKEKGVIEPLIEESKIQTEKIKEIHGKIVEKIMSKEKKLEGVKEASKKMEAFFKKKLGVLGLIEKVNKDRNDLQNELIGLIKKAKSFELSSKSRDTGTQVAELEKRFNEVDVKKKLFEEELKKVGSFFS